MPVSSSSSDAPIYQFKIRLLEISPMIWRRVLVEADTTLAELHRIVQITMGWDDYHLHRFQIYGCGYGDSGGIAAGGSERKAHLTDFGFRAGDVFYYEYDFGDRWEHEIRVEKLHEAPGPKKSYPVCIGGNRACPPEDCGGHWGYMELLNVLKGGYHPAGRLLREWVGSDFDPARFHRGPVNKRLKNNEHER